jgi:6-phosphogluconolactonase
MKFYVGTYTSGESKSKGIYSLDLDASSGTFSDARLVAETDDPSFLAVSRDGNFLYAVNETLEYEGKASGSVSAFAIDKDTGDLRLLNRRASEGAAPCHLSVSDDGKFVIVANYMGGTVAAFPVASDGSLNPARDIKKHAGRGPNADRQESAHAHCAIFDVANRFVFVCDLGIDRVVGYAVDSDAGKLSPLAGPYSTKPGAGPRHLKFHPNGKLAFINNELDMTVSSLSYNAADGTLEHVQTLSSLPAVYERTKSDSSADLHVSEDGRFLYVSNRSHDSIAAFSIDEATGKLVFLDAIKTGGKTPRNFALDPTGSFILAANQDSDSITVMRIDKTTGMLSLSEASASVPRPVCIVFAK